MTPIYLATAYSDGLTLAARCAADLPAHGLEVPTDAQWWRWPECSLPVELEHTQLLRARTLVIRAEHEVERCGRILVLLTDNCDVDAGCEVAYARLQGLTIYWLDCGRTKPVPRMLLAYGIKVASLANLAAKIKAGGR
jgi:hypothetical protein